MFQYVLYMFIYFIFWFFIYLYFYFNNILYFFYNNYLIKKYPFLTKDYFLSISRSLEDNKLDELCHIFKDSDKELVLISNFSKAEYGKNVLNKYSNINMTKIIVFSSYE